jgi:hypothetical protein
MAVSGDHDRSIGRSPQVGVGSPDRPVDAPPVE